MSRPRWITTAGNLGTIPELVFYERDLEVTTDAIGSNRIDSSVTYSFQSGELPPGIQVVRSGRLQGVPVVLEPITVDESREYRFTIRATSTDNVVVDRTFTLTVTNVFPPVIVPKINFLGNVFDGSYYEKQLFAVEENPNAQLKWHVTQGQLPPGISLSAQGLLSGYIYLEPDEYSNVLKGYDSYDIENSTRKNFYDRDPYDSVGKSRNRNYTFTVEVTDGANTDSLTYNLAVAAKGLFTADQDHFVNGEIEQWESGDYYPRGTIVNYNGTLYVVTQNVTADLTNTPVTATTKYQLYDSQKISITADNDWLTVDHDDKYLPIIITPPQSLPIVRQENNFAFKFDAVDFNGSEDLEWSLISSDGSGFDKDSSRNFPYSQNVYVPFTSDGTITTVAIDISNYPEAATYSVFGLFEPDGDDLDQDPDIVELELDTDYFVTVTGTQVDFAEPLARGKYYVGINMLLPRDFSESGVGFDSTVFDEGESRLPRDLSIDNNGWLHGYLLPQQEEKQTYQFKVVVKSRANGINDAQKELYQGVWRPNTEYQNNDVIEYNNNYYVVLEDHTSEISKPPGQLVSSLRYSLNQILYTSNTTQYDLTVLGSLTDRIIWKTPEFLGSIVNGSVSELKIEAVTEMGQDVRYSLVPKSRNRLPQSLSLDLLNDGLIVGRTTFRYFQLDDDATTFDRQRTRFDNVYTFDVKAETTNIKKVYSAAKNGAEYIDLAYLGNSLKPGQQISGQGIPTGTRIEEVIKTPVDNPGATRIKLTSLLTRDIDVGESIYILDGIVSSIKTFKVQVDVVHQEPYENLYFKAFPTLQQRQDFLSIINDQEIFPNELIYRRRDPWFGKATTIKFLALAGINASSLPDYIDAMRRNHYWKRINFGEIKTAVAVDEFYNIKYEVVYVEVVDPTNLSGAAVKEQVVLSGEPYIDENGIEHNVIYPSTFSNMSQNISNNLGYRARGVFPDWMTSVQPDKNVLGFRRAVVLAYTIPGAAKLIAYRLRSRNIRFDDIQFTIDRYQLDNALSKNYNTQLGSFVNSKETTFDRLILGPGVLDGGVVNYAVEQPFDSINKRTVSYIRSHGGIDGVKNFTDGDLLVFAQQEDYSGEVGPEDGWIDYQNLYVGDPVDNSDLGAVSNPVAYKEIDDVYGYDSYRVIPSIKNKSLTVEKHLLRTTASEGSTILQLPYILGSTYVGKTISAIGVPNDARVVSETLVDKNAGGPIADLVKEITISSPLIQDINSGSTITLRSAMIVAASDTNFSITVDSVPSGPIIGMILTGRNIPKNTKVTGVNGNVLTVNQLISVELGETIGYEIPNQRGGIWRVKIDDNDLVTLEFVNEVEIGQKIKVQSGQSNGFTFMVYDTNFAGPKRSLPAYRRWSEQIQSSTESTIFDGNGTKFFDRRDTYLDPEIDDKYLKFPQIGVFT